MSIVEFVSHLRNQDVRLSAEGERLRVNAPKGVLTDSLRSEIAERKQKLLQFLSDYDRPAAFTPPPILQRTSSEPALLSFAQERLWFLEQLESGSAVYNICRASRLTGQLNIAALESSLSEIVRRHEILRSQICIVDGLPVQITVAVSRFQLPVTDLRSFTETERELEVRDRIKAEAEWQFDFSAGLLLRAVLLQISDDQHILLLTTHHIVADAWSMGILTKEIWTLYDALANERPSPLQELAVQYADYSLWQREWLQGDVLESQLSYWKEQLKEVPILNLPTDHPRPVKQSFRGARQPLSLPESLTAAINELSRHEGVTQFMTLLAAFQVLLYRYSGQEDIVVGSPIANRNRTETEGLIGFFVNTLVLRSDCSGDPSFREFLLRVRDVCLGAYAHQDLPFEKLVEELRPERDLSRNPLFQVMFILQNTPRPLPQPAGLSIERVDVPTATSPFDLSLYLRERDGKLIGFVEYNTDLFESATIERVIGQFETLLEGIVANPEQPISTLPLLTETERHQLLVEWNDTAADYPKDSCIHDLVEAQVKRTPDAVAVQFEGKQLTYRELNARANQLAHYLQALGVGPEKLVGICVERSLEMVVSLLGILKAGGAYVPLDPAYPTERLAFMLSDSQCSFLVTQSTIDDGRWRIGDSILQSSILDSPPTVIYLDRDWPVIQGENTDNLQSQSNFNNVAYVIYTSGSTGQPKGVQVAHRSLVNCLWSIHQQLGLVRNDVLLAITTISFDIAALELYLPLITGAKVVVASRDKVLDGRKLSDKLTECGATAMQATPSSWKLLVDAGWRSRRNFRILSGGEVLSRQLADQLLEGGASLWNLYGPTETTIWSTMARVEAGDNAVPIGRPIANTQIYILDSHLQPVPVGAHGELYISGDGLARGYLNQPELSNERFVSNPFSSELGARLYRTGDVARFRPDGDIEFLRRADNQVKIHGYRVELGEIETILRQHSSVKDCVVDVHERESYSGQTLVCYLVPSRLRAPSVNELRLYLKQRLPEYMIPSMFVMLEALPLMPNGKVHRQLLPALNHTGPWRIGEVIAPRSQIEELVVQIWKEVLKVEDIGIHDSFFELGGHSLLAVRIISRLRDAFNREIPLHVLFDAPTATDLALIVENLLREDCGPDFPPIVSVPHHGPVPLSTNQEQLWYLNQMIPGTSFFNMPYVYRLSGNLNVVALERSLREIVRRHESLRTVFAKFDGKPVQIIKEEPVLELPVVDLRTDSPDSLSQQAADLIVEERSRPFDLEEGPLLRVRLLWLKDSDYFLLVTLHHIIGDQWSIHIFCREIASLYEAFSQDQPSPLHDPPIQFADYAVWERRLLESGGFDVQLEYWKRELLRPLPQVESKESQAPRKGLSLRRAEESIEFDESLWGRIKTLARKDKYTPFMIIVTALSIVLYLYNGNRDIRIATLAANRRRKEADRVIGYLVNTIILRVRVLRKMTVNQLLQQVRGVTFAAYAHQDLPFEYLVRGLALEQNYDKRNALAQVLFRYETAISEFPHISGLDFAPVDLRGKGLEPELALTNFDFIFTMRETSTALTASVNYEMKTHRNKAVTRMMQSFRNVLKKIETGREKFI